MRPGPSRDGSRGPGRVISYMKWKFAASGVFLRTFSSLTLRVDVSYFLAHASGWCHCIANPKRQRGSSVQKFHTRLPFTDFADDVGDDAILGELALDVRDIIGADDHHKTDA